MFNATAADAETVLGVVADEVLSLIVGLESAYIATHVSQDDLPIVGLGTW
jgi:hypothetical protein